MSKKPKSKVSNIMLVLICTMIIIYTIADFLLQYFAGVEVSSTLTMSWFAFWGTELVALAAIKTSKVKHGQDNAEESEDESNEEIEVEDNSIINEEE